jgi:hypothetical protein
MERKVLKSVLIMILLMFFSCNETVVTNIVHPDGSVTRRIVIQDGDKKSFEPAALRVPFDSSWNITDSFKTNEKGDTFWIRTAEKLFKNVDEINLSYKKDKGVNSKMSRNASFTKKFRWFNTEYRFSESIEKQMLYGYPIKDFLNQEELMYFYSPEWIKSKKQNGPDSTKFKTFEDTINRKVDRWSKKSFVSEMITEFSRLLEGKEVDELKKETLKAREDTFVKIIAINEKKLDSLWKEGIILKDMIGEKNSIRFRNEADSAYKTIVNRCSVPILEDYSVQIIMPGKVFGTNGFIDTTKVLNWPVKAEYFLTEPYEMWAESKTSNTWAWIVSGVFLLFVLTGLVFRLIKK